VQNCGRVRARVKQRLTLVVWIQKKNKKLRRKAVIAHTELRCELHFVAAFAGASSKLNLFTAELPIDN